MNQDRLEWIKNKQKGKLPVTSSDVDWLLEQLDGFVWDQTLVKKLLDDYDRRRSTRWGRFLLWLLNKTT